MLDASGNPIEVSYRPEGSTTTKFYYYVQNLQGDVIALVDSANGNTVVTYTYDAWGNVLSTNGSLATTLGVLNPFRYRGYVYDSETKLYYLQSRYYNPEMGRFINADTLVATGQGIHGNNMFAYCGNNPINYTDHSGCIPWHIIIAALVGAGVSAIVSLMNGDSAMDVLSSSLTGAAIGATVSVYPQLAVVFASYEMTSKLLDCMYMGLSVEESLVVLGLSAATNIGFTSTGDDAADLMVDVSFGTGKDLLLEAGIISVEDSQASKPNQATVTHGIISMFCISGGGRSGVSEKYYDITGRVGLWVPL